MVNIKEVRLSNAELKVHSKTNTAVFVGATQGIGKSTLIQLAKNVPTPKAYIVGRSLAKSVPLLDELKTINPRGTFTFIEGEISLIKEVDRICDEIKSKENSVDLLFISAGGLTLAGRHDTVEGLDVTYSVAYYERIRFMQNLLPLLSKSQSSRVVSVLAAGQEGKILLDDLELRNNFSVINAASHSGTNMSLSMNQLAKSYPNVSFVHIFPGMVATDLLLKLFGTTSGIWSVLGFLGLWIFVPINRLFCMSVEEAGERGLFVATSARYGLSGPEGNFQRLGPDDEPVKANSIYEKMTTDGTDAIVYKHTVNVFDRITARD